MHKVRDYMFNCSCAESHLFRSCSWQLPSVESEVPRMRSDEMSFYDAISPRVLLFRSCSWQLPKVESEVPRMSSDVGVSRIWNRMLDAAFDNSNR